MVLNIGLLGLPLQFKPSSGIKLALQNIEMAVLLGKLCPFHFRGVYEMIKSFCTRLQGRVWRMQSQMKFLHLSWKHLSVLS